MFFRGSVNSGVDAARSKFTEHREKLKTELDTQLRLVEKLDSDIAPKRELHDVARLGTNSHSFFLYLLCITFAV